MSIIPGSIPVTGFIAPTDTADTYAVTDAIYGIDGLRNVAGLTARDNISIERRRAGMIVGTLDDGKYWRLKNQSWTLGDPNDWELFLQIGASGSVVSNGNKYFIGPTEELTIPLGYQYWIYGNLILEGQLTNNGQLVIADGSLIMSGGTFSNFGTASFVSLENKYKFNSTQTIGMTYAGLSVSSYVMNSSLNPTHLNTLSSATAGYILSVDSYGTFSWIVLPSVTIYGGAGLTTSGATVSLNTYPVYQQGLTTSASNGNTGLTLSYTPMDYFRIQVFVNGALQYLSQDSNGDCYFGASGTTFSNLVAGDTLYWNSTSAGFTLSPTDKIDIIYNR